MFHIRKNEGNLSLLLHILNNVPMTLQKREILIDLLAKIDKEKYPNDAKNSEYRILENLKIGVPTSKAYAECIESAKERFHWSPIKMWMKRFQSFFTNIVFGFGLYFFDVFTDIQFSTEMFKN